MSLYYLVSTILQNFIRNRPKLYWNPGPEEVWEGLVDSSCFKLVCLGRPGAHFVPNVKKIAKQLYPILKICEKVVPDIENLRESCTQD